MKEQILEKLNPAQKEAVTWPAKPLLIIAGAGSGKTRILTHRIAYTISEGVPPFQILGVTFTNKAAAEMKNRVIRLVRQDVWVSTFHSTCMRILRMDGPAIGLARDFTVYDEHDQLVIIKEILKDMGIDDKQVHPKGVRERIQRAKDFLMSSYQMAEKSQDLYEETVAKVYKVYEQRMSELKACDFGDLIFKTVALFDQKAEVLRTWQDRFQHILVDEYQDTNHAQYRFIKLLAHARRQITVVGDPDQSIYAWRGADIRNILHFENDYPECGIIKMEQNYRSTSIILDAANELIQRNQIRKPKALWTEREGGEPIAIFQASSEKDEAEFVVGEIMKQRAAGRTLADQVIFYRTHAQSRVFEDALRRMNIPYKIVGGTRFYDRREIKDIVAYLRVILYPHDEVNLKRILNVPARGLGKKTLDTIFDFARTRQILLDDALRRVSEIEGLPPRAVTSVRGFCAMLKSWRERQADLQPGDILTEVLEKTGYAAMLEQEKTVESAARIENIEEFFSVVHDFQESFRPEAAEGMTALGSFLESISLFTNLDSWDQGTDVLTMMTLHTAKGLEFPVAYMVGMEEGMFPSGSQHMEDPEDLEEERRLCYVGITRAKDKLTMTYARERMLYGSRHYNLPSRFLNEIPQNLYKFTGRQSQAAPQVDIDDVEIEFDPDETRRRILFDD